MESYLKKDAEIFKLIKEKDDEIVKLKKQKDDEILFLESELQKERGRLDKLREEIENDMTQANLIIREKVKKDLLKLEKQLGFSPSIV